MTIFISKLGGESSANRVEYDPESSPKEDTRNFLEIIFNSDIDTLIDECQTTKN
jgi:hypothetical protein